ncbi:MAG: DUF5317 domain-containing protein [Chloroflexi bacterium]|nr:DUF5317 domain-containing protein [Chloroflexota bacterium]
MILLTAILLGLLAGFARALIGKHSLRPFQLRLVWLLAVAFLAQAIVFRIPAIRVAIPDQFASLLLVSSQAVLLIFAWVNRRQPGFWILGAGLALNFLVIALNGGWMPISPDLVTRLAPGAAPGSWAIGSRLGYTKDIVLTLPATRLWWLSDRFLLPDGFPYVSALSLGDILIAAGALVSCWSLGRPSRQITQLSGDTYGDALSSTRTIG